MYRVLPRHLYWLSESSKVSEPTKTEFIMLEKMCLFFEMKSKRAFWQLNYSKFIYAHVYIVHCNPLHRRRVTTHFIPNGSICKHLQTRVFMCG